MSRSSYFSEMLVKLHLHFGHTVILILPNNIPNTAMVVSYCNTKLVSPHLKNKIKQIVHKCNILLNYHNNVYQVKLLKITIKLSYYNVT